MKVSGDENANKWYRMQENADGTFTVTYGREGAKGAIENYPMSRWDSKLNEKLSSKKGYTDVTEHRTEATAPVPKINNSKGASIISHDKHVISLIEALQSYASAQTAVVYKAEAKGVTQRQIDDAQKHLDNLSHSFKNYYGKREWSLSMFNTELTKLYIIIPRKMGKVADHLVATDWKKEQIERLIGDEQSNLDSMASQVVQNVAQDAADASDTTAVTQQTLLDMLGLEMSLVTDQKEIDTVKKRAEANEQRKKVTRIFKVLNKTTQAIFDKKVRSSKDKKTELLFHGSRNANWFFIIQQGLKIRPSGAVITGAMFGNFVYFASESGKSMGYTDGGRWTGGGASKIYMGLYEVHVGKQLIKHSHDSSCYDLHNSISKTDCDSVWAKKGPSLNRDEFMVNSDQSTIKYLIEFSA